MLSGNLNDSFDPLSEYSTLEIIVYGGRFSPSLDLFTELVNYPLLRWDYSSYYDVD
jgi:hypothetical protein